MKKIWIVVANRSDAKIYQAENRHKLIEHTSLTHQEAHLHDRDIISDSAGCISRHGHSSETLSRKTTVQDKESALFAKEIAGLLEKSCNSGECEKIYIISKVPFLSFLRESLSPNVIKLIEAEIQKDIVDFNAEKIRSYLPDIL